MMQASQLSPIRVLIVEDNVMTSREITRQLTNLGYTLTEKAFSGQEAIEKARQSHPDLILMDIHLGEGIDGTEAAERIWNLLKIPIVYLTAYTDAETLRKAKISEPFGYILKPFDEQTLYVAIEMALSKHQAELLVAQQKGLLTEVFDHVQEGIALVDECGKIVFCNPAYAAIVGERLSGNLFGESVFQFFEDEAREMLIEEMKVRKHGQSSTYEVPLISLHEDRRWVRLTVVPRFDAEQQWIGEFVTMLDITDRKCMELELQRAKDIADQVWQHAEASRHLAELANDAKGEFLAHLSHELRTPLNAILGYAHLMLRHNSLSEQSHNAVEMILRSGEHLLTMINEVLDFSKIEARKIELDEAPFQVSGFLKSILDIVQAQAQGKDICFTCDIDPGLPPWIRGDETRLRQVLINLLNNALKFTEQGNVVFRVKKIIETSRLRFEVEDTGIGIPPEQIEKIFLPFSQVHPKRIAFKGTGLGLPICQNLLNMMGTDLSVESIPGKGSRFWFELEVATGEAFQDISTSENSIKKHHFLEMESQKTIIGFHGQSATILIVGDHEMSRALIRDTLQRIGFTILEASNGFDGMEKVRIFHPEIVLMDLMMPTLDGFETVRRLRQESEADMLIIGISADVAEEVRIKSLEAGCNYFLPKPLELGTLLTYFEQHLNLEWVFREPSEQHDRDIPADEYRPFQGMALVPPSQEDLLRLHKLARSGDIAGIRTLLPELAADNTTLIPFIDRLHELVKGFHINEIKIFLEKYLQKLSGDESR